MKKYIAPSFADSICDLRIRKVKSTFFDQINSLIDWKSISKMIDAFYHKGKSALGRPSYDGLYLFKIEATSFGLFHLSSTPLKISEASLGSLFEVLLFPILIPPNIILRT